MKFVGHPFQAIPKNPNSHVRGWAIHWAETTGAEVLAKGQSIPKGSTLLVDHGVNFGGSLNLFGGLTDELAETLTKFVDEWDQSNTLISCDIDMPDYAGMMAGRLDNASTSPKMSKALLDKFDQILKTSKTETQLSMHTGNLLIGDSHTASFTPVGYTGLRKNGQTLHGALNSDYIKQIVDAEQHNLENLALCFGSIDIRHHLFRQDSVKDTIRDLANRLEKLVKYINYIGIEVKICAPVPVEFEGRKLPKTGYYKGTPFAGSLRERRAATYAWISTLEDRFGRGSVIMPPLNWYEMDGEKFAKEYMEFGGSVHLSPRVYNRFDWGKLTDQPKVSNQVNDPWEFE